MNIQIALSAAVMAVTTLVHVFVGGPEIMDPLNETELPDMIRAILGVVWHGVTVLLAVMAVAAGWLARQRNTALFALLVALLAGFIGLFLWYGLRQLGNITDMPQWAFFAVALALLLWGQPWRQKKTPAVQRA